MKTAILLLSLIVLICADLKLVQVITRHGARTPYTIIPNDKTVWDCDLTALSTIDTTESAVVMEPQLYRKRYMESRQVLPGNCSQGYLTKVGSQNHFVLGQYFRRRYIDELRFMPSMLDTSVITIRSTDIERTIQSAESQLLGMYPAANRPFTQRVIDIFTIQAATDNMYPNNKCPKLIDLCAAVQMSSDWTSKVNQYASLKTYLEVEWNSTDIPFWIGIFNLLQSRQFHGLPPPTGISAEISEKITDLSFWQLVRLYRDPQIIRLAIGDFLGELADRMEDVIQGRPTQKWHLYSGHDVTLALLMSGFDLLEKNGEWPGYASNLVLELHQSNGWFVQVYWNHKIQIIPGCQNSTCPWETFKNLVGKLIPTNLAGECSTKEHVGLKYRPYSNLLGETDITSFFC